MSSNPAPERRPWSLAARLTVWYAAVTFALVLAATGYLFWALARNMDREDDQFIEDAPEAVGRHLLAAGEVIADQLRARQRADAVSVKGR